MQITDTLVRKVITHLVNGQDYRAEVLTLINASFLQYAIDFFKRVAEAKLNNKTITEDWYKETFLNSSLPSNQIIINAGINKKTFSNIYKSAKRDIVIKETSEYYDKLSEAINTLAEQDKDIDIILTIKFRGVSIELSINESLIVINTLAVKRAELTGGAWSSAGKQVEKRLMQSLCVLYQVPRINYDLTGLTDAGREVDFYLIDTQQQRYRCEVKLMGKGNPESADVIIARSTQVFIADTLSDLNKKQLDSLKIHWIELRSEKGYRKFNHILESLDIPHTDFNGNLEERLTEIFSSMFDTPPSDTELIED